MKIGFFVGEFPVISETFVMNQIVNMLKRGHQVTVITCKKGKGTVLHEKFNSFNISSIVQPIRFCTSNQWRYVVLLLGFAINSLFSIKGRRQLFWAIFALRKKSIATLLDIACQSHRGHLGHFDAIIAHFGPAGVRAMYLQKAGLLGGPIATVFHGFDMSEKLVLKKHKSNYQLLFKETAMMLPVCQLWKQRLQLLGAPLEKIRIMRMGVDLDGLTFLNANRSIGRPLKVLSVGRFVEKKGLKYAIEGVCKAHASISMKIVGDGPLLSELKELAKKAIPNKTIHFYGNLTQEEIFKILVETDVFLLPSITADSGEMEGIPVAIMEAMAKGILVISTCHSGIPELVIDARAGYLVEERNSEQIATILDSISLNSSHIEDVRLYARQRIENLFNNKLLIVQMENICKALRDDVFDNKQ